MPGILEARCQRSDDSISARLDPGLLNTMNPTSCPCVRAITLSSSARLARVQGQSGWLSITSVNLPGGRTIPVRDGQMAGGVPGAPGVLSYRNSACAPERISRNQRETTAARIEDLPRLRVLPGVSVRVSERRTVKIRS